MSTRVTCPGPDALVSYLYGEFEPGEGPSRRDVSRHLSECAACATEIAALGGVREQLAAWTTPEAELGFQIIQSPLRDVSREGHFTGARDEARTGLRRWWSPARTLAGGMSPDGIRTGGRSTVLGPLPMAAAAMLVLGATLGLARLDVQYDASGFRVRTGWGHDASGTGLAGAPGAQAGAAGGAAHVAGGGATAAPTVRAITADDLAAFEAKWRRELASSVTATSVVADAPATTLSPAAEAAVLKRLRQIIEESEVRQQQNLQLRVTELSRDFQMRRQADLVQIEQGFGRLAGDNAAQRQIIREYFRNANVSGAGGRPQQ
jgi:hypothetical protein